MKDWARKIRKHFKIFIHFKRINFLERLAFRAGFFFLMSGVILQIFLNLVFVKVIFGWITDIRGWNYYEVLIIVGTSIFIEGVIWMTCAYLHALKFILKNGALDGLLVKPMDSQFLVSCYRGDLEDLVRLVLGSSVIIYALSHLSVSGSELFFNGILFVILLINSYIIIYSIAVILNSISFWTVESPTTYAVLEMISRISQYPADIFSGFASKLVFSTIIPVLFIATVPAEALAHGLDWSSIPGSFIVAILFLFLSRYVWNKGLGVYSSASS